MMFLWYLARAAGITALIALSLATAMGAWSSGAARRPTAVNRRVIFERVHRAAAVTGLGLLVVHVLSLVLDGKSGISAAATVIPMASGYRPFAVTLGVLAMYAVVFAAAVGAARGRMAASPAAARSWRALHATAYLGWLMAIGHGVLAGTDAGADPVLLIDLVCVLLVVGAWTRRWKSEQDHDSGSLATARRQARDVSSEVVR